MRLVFLLSSLPLLLSGAAPAAAPYSFDHSAVVRVECNGGLSVGSAVKIGEQEYITAAHVVSSGACTIEGQPIKNVYLNIDQDFATFDGPKNNRRIKVSCRGYSRNDNYLSVGYAFGWERKTYEPLIYSGIDLDGFASFTGEIIPGMSGGPVIDYSGRVVGINNMRWPARSMALRDTKICR